jgi:hypothetical protein
MTIIESISAPTLREFATWLLSNQYNAKDVIQGNDLGNSLYFYLEFLSQKHSIFIIRADLETLCYLMKGNPTRKLIHFQPSTKDSLADYKDAILNSFKFIEEPF